MWQNVRQTYFETKSKQKTHYHSTRCSYMEEVKIAFSANGTVNVEVDDPTDADSVLEAFVDEMKNMDDAELMNILNTDADWMAENVHYVDGEDGEVYHEW